MSREIVEEPSEQILVNVYLLISVYTTAQDEKRLIYSCSDREDAILWVADLLDCVANFNLMGVLNDLQVDDKGQIVFSSKWDIPLRIVNLLIEKYKIMVVEEKI